MNHLEQIRERVVPGAILSYGTVGDIANMYSTDIRYLLSKLAIAEKALEIALQGDGVTRQYEEVTEDYTQLYNAVNEVLKQIRE